MNIDSLNERKQTLEEQLEQAMANVNAIMGAIQEVDYWINQIKN